MPIPLPNPDRDRDRDRDRTAPHRDHGHPELRLKQELDAARELPGQLALGLELDVGAMNLSARGQKFIEPYERLLATLVRRAAEFAT